MLLALDDTDGPTGGCTTHVATSILRRLKDDQGLAPAGLPRLVRLFPANRWKTRGNAAVALRLRLADPERLLDLAFGEVKRWAKVGEGKGAGVALFEEAPPEVWYQRGVQGPIDLAEAKEAVEELALGTRTLGNGRGLIGALCAAAWRPGELATYERIAYREQARWGTPRQVDPASLQATEDRFEALFDCLDPIDGYPVMVPRTPCPVLYGLRGTDLGPLARAQGHVVSEPVAFSQSFVTNQASDDHVLDEALVPVTASGPPEALPGGHVRLPATTDQEEARTLMAFEPTGKLRHGLLKVREGDTVLPVGDLREGQVNLEKLLHVPAASRRRQGCPACGRAMGSAGRDQGVRCRRCGHRAPARHKPGEARWIEADVSARRHLARPLSLGLAPRVDRAAEALLTAPRASPA